MSNLEIYKYNLYYILIKYFLLALEIIQRLINNVKNYGDELYSHGKFIESDLLNYKNELESFKKPLHMIIIEGLDKSGKSTFAKTFIEKGYEVVEFPIRDGHKSEIINEYLSGNVEYSEEIECAFKENRIHFMENLDQNKKYVFVRSGISYLVYKSYRNKKEITDEEIKYERKFISNSTLYFLSGNYKDDSKKEIYDNLEEEERSKILNLYYDIMSRIKIE